MHPLSLLIFSSCCCSILHAEVLQQQPKPYFDFNAQKPKDILDVNYDNQKKDYAVLNTKLYQSERVRVFNYTAYDSAELNSTLKSNNLGLGDLTQLSVSFGYGIEFLVNQHNKVGYEFLSSFPYDRGQLIRLFWVRAL